MQSVESIAQALAFGPYAISRQGLIAYVDEQMRMLLCHKDAGRNPRKQKEWRYWQAGIKALELRDTREKGILFPKDLSS